MNMFDENRPCSIEELQNIITAPAGSLTLMPSTSFDTICDGILLGEGDAAKNVSSMKQLGVTHVLNAALGKDAYHVNTNHVMYKKRGIEFLGIEATDMMNCDISKYFYTSSNFIHECLSTGGKVFVHCVQGVSRSATLVIAYFMIKQHKTVQDAVRYVRSKREISPNPGFLQQLCNLNEDLKKSGHFSSSSSDQANDIIDNDNADLKSKCEEDESCTVQDLEKILLQPSGGLMMLPSSSFSQINENIALGESNFIDKSDRIQRFGITHVLNVAYKQGANSDTTLYEQMGVKFLGLAAQDTLNFDISQYFEPGADFIDDAVKTKGCIFVHCVHGVSRSASIVIAFLMIKKHYPVKEAVRYVRKKRQICPNDHFLQQLCDLNFKLKHCGHYDSLTSCDK